MAMHKAIKSGKEHRVEYSTKGQPYCKAVDKTCCNHGRRSGDDANQCPWCLDNRIDKYKNMDKIAKKEIRDFQR